MNDKQNDNCLFIYSISKHFENRDCFYALHGPVSQAVMCSSLERKISGTNLDQSNRTRCCQRLATAEIMLRREMCCPGAMTRKLAPQIRYALRRNTASIIEDLIFCFTVMSSMTFLFCFCSVVQGYHEAQFSDEDDEEQFLTNLCQ